MNKHRRLVLKSALASGLLGLGLPTRAVSDTPLITRAIPSSGEALPAIGLGSWITFDVGYDLDERNARAELMRQFFAAGGKMIDSSPMYGSAQEVIGYCLQKLNMHEQVFSTDKVWTFDGGEGQHQIARSQKRWGVPRFDLLQVHNILSWEDHLPTLQEMKTSGKVRYVGITTSHGRRHREFEKIMQSQSLDFIQLTYNMRDREAENRLLPLAKELGIAVIINRPFQRGSLIDWAKKHPLPGWANDIDCSNWAQFLLKFIISHPAVTCAIPATSRVDHLMENMGAASGRLPDAAMRQKMLAYVESL